jgi:hypothetical protein
LSEHRYKGIEMAERELSSDPTGALEKARVTIETARKLLQGLHQEFALTNETAKEIARNELCRSLIERLQLAEREAAELAGLVDLARKAP